MEEAPYQTKRGPNSSSHYKDRGYAWVILLASMFLMSLMTGSMSSYSIMLPEYVDYFQVSTAEASLVISLAKGAAAATGILAGTLIRLYGIRRMSLAASLLTTAGYVISAYLNNFQGIVVAHGLLLGSATMFHMTAAIVAVPTYFHKNKAFAFSMVTVGFTLGTVVWSPVIQALVDHYGKHGLLVFAGINLNGLVASALLRPPPPAKPPDLQVTSSSEKWCRDCRSRSLLQENFSFLKDLKAIIYFISILFILNGHLIPFYYLPARVQAFGAAKQQGALLLSVLGAVRLLVSPGLGRLGDRMKRHRTAIYGASAIACGVLTAATCSLHSFVPLLVFVCAYGAVSTAFSGLYLTILSDVIPLRQMAVATGVMNTVIDTCQMLFNTLAGHMVDVSGSYATPFLVFGCLLAVGGGFGLLLYALQLRSPGTNAPQDTMQQHTDGNADVLLVQPKTNSRLAATDTPTCIGTEEIESKVDMTDHSPKQRS